MKAYMIYKTQQNWIFTHQKENLTFFLNMTSNYDLPKKGKKKKKYERHIWKKKTENERKLKR